MMPSKHRPQRPHCSSGTEGGSALQQRGSALQQPASAMRAAGTQKLRVVGYDRGVHVPLAPLLRRRRSAQSSGHVHILSVRGKLRVRVGGGIGDESVGRWTALQMGSRAKWSARSASAINESRQNGAERGRGGLGIHEGRACDRATVKCVNAISSVGAYSSAHTAVALALSPASENSLSPDYKLGG